MHIFHWFQSSVQVQITSADLPGCFCAASERDIMLSDVVFISDLTAKCTVSRRSAHTLRELCLQRGDRLERIRNKGAYWQLIQFANRPVLIAGLFLLLTCALVLPTRIFFVQVEGNGSIPAKRILEAAQEAGIRFGASRREVRSEKVKNTLLEAVPQLQWAGVNTYGCVAKISVRERSVTESSASAPKLSSIVADRDGIITSCTATRGNLLCTVGQAVTEGEVLISGYTDCGIFIQATNAEGEVFAQTRREIHAVMPTDSLVRTSKKEEMKKISLIIGKKRINLWKDSGIWDTTCGRIYKEYYVTLPGDFCLPAGLAVECYTQYDMAPGPFEQNVLEDFARDYLQKQMLAGTIHSAQLQQTANNGCYLLTGEFICTEMIGRVRAEEIGDNHGESD